VLQASAGPDVASKVAVESMENLQTHDGFAQQQKLDEAREKMVKANKDLSALQVASKNAPESDVASKVATESKENLQIHDGFAVEQKADEENERRIRSNKDLSALQLGSKTVPGSDVAKKVAVETRENIQIHDGFAQQQREDEEKEGEIRANKDLSALQLRSQTAPTSDIAKKVAVESMENLQIHDGFAQQQRVDEEKERRVKADKTLSALQLQSKTLPGSDVAHRVAIESRENLQIHDTFVRQQAEDEEKEKEIKARKEMSALQLRSQTAPASDVASEVAVETLQNLQIHDGFFEQQKKDEEREREVKANKDLSAIQVQSGNAPDSDVAKKVAIESRQNLQIHDGFVHQQHVDEQVEKSIKADKELSALQFHGQETPDNDVAKRVAAESSDKIQIHDDFVYREKKSIEVDKAVRANKDLRALQLRSLRASK